MKCFRLIGFFLVIYGLGLMVGFWYLSASNTRQAKAWLWGVNIGAFALNNLNDPYQPQNVDQQIRLVKQLGVSVVRANLEVDKNVASPQPRDAINDDVINRLDNAGLKILLIIEDPFKGGTLFDVGNQQNGWAWGYKIASRYKGKVYAYQLANEVSGKVIKDQHSGRTFSDFDSTKYQILKSWLIGLSTGIHDADPQAKRVVSAHWVATAIIDQLIADQLPFEVIGWNWFSDMGDNPINKAFEDGTIIDLPSHFVGQGKEFWFTELNRSHGSDGVNGSVDQARFLKQVIDNIVRSPNVSAIFVYTLLDDPIAPNPIDQRWGLVEAKIVNDRPSVVGQKPAFLGFQELIKIWQQRPQ